MKKIAKTTLVFTLGIAMMISNLSLLTAQNRQVVETSPTSIPSTYAESISKDVNVTETSKWTNTALTKGEVTIEVKTTLGQSDRFQKNQDIYFVSDLSGSMSGERKVQMMKALKESAQNLLNPTLNLNNRVSLVSFDDRVWTDYELGYSLTDFNTAVETFDDSGKGGGGTNYEDALKRTYDLIQTRTDKAGRSPVVIFMTDGNPRSMDGVDLYQKQIKSLGAIVYSVQYMNGSTTMPVLNLIATSEKHAYNAVKTSYINDIYNSIINKILTSKSYENVKVEFEVIDANFALKDVSVEVGSVKKDGNKLSWTIPSLIAGANVKLITKVNLKDNTAAGNLLAHKRGSVAYQVTDMAGIHNIDLESTTLDRTMYRVKFDTNGANSGTAPYEFSAAASSMINVPSNPNGLGKTGKVFLGWTIQGSTNGLLSGTTQMPNKDLILKAEWGTPSIQMDTGTITVKKSHLVNADGFDSTLGTAVMDSVFEVEFVNTLAPVTTPMVFRLDASIAGEEKIEGWVDGGTLYIGSKGRIFAPEDCTKLFSKFTKARTIVFNGYLDTSEVTNMQGMFSGNNYLKTLDLSTFNTRKVTTMAEMFEDQLDLKTVNVYGIDFDTSKVMDMSQMFNNCGVTLFDLRGFNFDSVNNFTEMLHIGSNTPRTVYVATDSDKVKISSILSGFGKDLTNVEVKPLDARSKTVTNNAIPVAQAADDADGQVDGGRVDLNYPINYKITVDFDSDVASRSGIMKVTNIIPSELTFETGSISIGTATWKTAGNSGLPSGTISGQAVNGNVLTFYVNQLSAGSKIDLTYEALTPASLSVGTTYQEVLNQSSLSIEDVNISSNYVRHYLGDDTVIPAKYNLTYAYDVSAPVGAPSLPKVNRYAAGQEVVIPTKSMTGYVFNGWKNGAVQVNDGLMNMPGNDVTLIGSWTKVDTAAELKGKVSYRYDGIVPPDLDPPAEESYVVGNNMGGIDVIHEKSVTLPIAPTVEGYDFVGWESPNVSDAEIESGSFQLSNEEITLTGKWKKHAYQVTYKYADGTILPAGAPSLPIAENKEWGGTVTTASKYTDVNGYTFDGWYSDSDIDPDFQENFIMPKSDVTIYAYWTKQTHLIHYQYDGDIPMDATPQGTSVGSAGETVHTWEVPASRVTSKDGVTGTWLFNGWVSDDVSINRGSFTMPNNNVILRGSWTFTPNPNVRSVTFNVVNGKWSNGNDDPIMYYVTLVNGVATLPMDEVPMGMYSNDGYTDGHWIVQPNTETDGIVDHVVYTYRFEKKPVVTFKVEHGTWADGTDVSQSILLDMISGKATLVVDQVPIGMKANAGYHGGKWDDTPNLERNAITGDVTYTYRFNKQNTPITGDGTNSSTLLGSLILSGIIMIYCMMKYKEYTKS